MLTHRGIAVAVATVLAYAAAAALHYPELGILAAGGLTVLVLGAGWVVRRPHVRIQRFIEPARVTRGEVALGLLEITNPGRIAVSPTVAEEQCGPRTVAVDVPRLPPGATTRTTYRLPTDRRAVIDIGPLTVARQDPFGCWRTTQRLGTTERLWVHPVVHPLLALPTGRTRSLDGPDRDGLPHGSITFHALREYVPGDDLRHVHWRSSARTGTLMVREHVDTSLPQVTLVVDTSSASHTDEGFEQAVEVAASLVAVVTAARLPLRLVTTGGESVRGRGVGEDARAMLDLLAGVQTGEGALLTVVNHLAAERRGDVLLAVIGAAAVDELTALGALGARYSRGVVAVVADGADEVPVPVPPHLRVIRVATAAAFGAYWEQVGFR
ncbi:MAG: DUF58 domain-containing protein [Acidimicrobiales bacterium]